MAPCEGPLPMPSQFKRSLHHNYSFILCNNVQLWSHFSQPLRLSGCLSANQATPSSCSLTSQNLGAKVPNSLMRVISTFCCCDRIPKSLVNIGDKEVISLWDTGSSICLMSFSLVQRHFSSLLPCLTSADSEVFTAGNHQLTVLGTLSMTVKFNLFSAPCVFLVIQESLRYIIFGFDFMSAQQIFVHPELGVISSQFDHRNAPVSPPVNTVHSLNTVNALGPLHTCIPVLSAQDYQVPPHSSMVVDVIIDYSEAKTSSQPGKSIVISSECLEKHDDWTNLAVFFFN